MTKFYAYNSLAAFVVLILFSGCGRHEFRKSDVSFLFSSQQAPVKRPSFHFYKYTSFLLFNGEIVLTYIYDDTLAQLFTLDGSINKLSTLSSSAENDNSSVSFLHADDHLLFLRHKGELFVSEKDSFLPLLDIWKLNRLRKDNMELAYQANTGNYGCVYRDSLLIVPLNLGFEKGKTYRSIYEPYPFFACVNLHSHSVKYLNFYAPPHYLRHSHFMNNSFQGTLAGDKLIVSYPYSPTVDVYSLTEHKIVGQQEMRSNFQYEAIQELPADVEADDVKYRYNIQSAYYSSLVYNPFLHQYYRVFYAALPEKNENGEFTILKDKRVSVAVFDHNFNFIGEHRFSDKTSIVQGISPTPDGFVVNSSVRDTKDGISLLHIKIKAK